MKIFLAHEETGFANVDGNWRIAADRDDYSDDVDYKETLGEYVPAGRLHGPRNRLRPVDF